MNVKKYTLMDQRIFKNLDAKFYFINVEKQGYKKINSSTNLPTIA